MSAQTHHTTKASFALKFSPISKGNDEYDKHYGRTVLCTFTAGRLSMSLMFGVPWAPNRSLSLLAQVYDVPSTANMANYTFLPLKLILEQRFHNPALAPV